MRGDSFNRTSVELKTQFNISSTLLNALAFNRTSVELKLANTSDRIAGTSAFNRTSVELKHEVGGWENAQDMLLIEPVWN